MEKLLILAAAIIAVSFGREGSCPSNCICMDELEVTCEAGNLQDIPDSLPSSIESLRILGNNITDLLPDQFRLYPNLKVLILQDTNIRRIWAHAFRGLPRLLQLYILRNPLTILEPFSFSDLHSVKKVHINNNRIVTISRKAFAGSRHIRMLSLERNAVELVETNAFSDLFGVEFLFLPEKMTIIKEDAFNGLQNVHVMEIQGWQTAGILPYTFRGLRSVKNIKIVESSLGVIKPYAFAEVQSIESIQIVNSNIRKLRRKSFAGTQYVGALELKNNTIHRWEPGTFADIPNANLLALALVQNRLDCACHNLWFLGAESTPPDPMAAMLPLNFCGHPKSFEGRRWSELTLGHLSNCTSLPSVGFEAPPTADYDEAKYLESDSLTQASGNCVRIQYLMLTVLVIVPVFI